MRETEEPKPVSQAQISKALQPKCTVTKYV